MSTNALAFLFPTSQDSMSDLEHAITLADEAKSLVLEIATRIIKRHVPNARCVSPEIELERDGDVTHTLIEGTTVVLNDDQTIELPYLHNYEWPEHGWPYLDSHDLSEIDEHVDEAAGRGEELTHFDAALSRLGKPFGLDVVSMRELMEATAVVAEHVRGSSITSDVWHLN
jgi:hypothetical protein